MKSCEQKLPVAFFTFDYRSISLKVNSAKNLMVLRSSSVKGNNVAHALTLRVTKSLKGLLTYS